MTFTAKYFGLCAGCTDAITPGDQVRYDGSELTHDRCATEPPVTLCPECHLATPCWCGDDE